MTIFLQQQTLQGRIFNNGLDFSIYLKNRNDHNFFIKPTDRDEILKQINNLNANKATGPHSIPNEILQVAKYIIADPLEKTIKLSFEKGEYFHNLKISKAIPLFKDKGSVLECVNYRPISLLSNINKIIEKIMYTRLYNFLIKHSCIYENQFGFRN